MILRNTLVEGLDYIETFALVAKMVTACTLLSADATRKWEIHQMDVHNAFLHGDLQGEVYMKLPPDFSKRYEGKVCKLQKSLHGLKQAPPCWFTKLTGALNQCSFCQSYSNYSLFIYSSTSIFLCVLLYMDDQIITGNNFPALQKVKANLSTSFHMKNLGPLKYFLGIEVARSKKSIYLYQHKYVLDILFDDGFLGAKPLTFPIEHNHLLGKAKGSLLPNLESYQRLVGRLIYLTFTQPNLAYLV